MSAIECEGIAKSYGGTEALRSVDLDVAAGEIFGIIGPDGAGKTTLFRILATLLLADRGTARVAGYDVVEQYSQVRHRVGYMPGKFSLYQDLTVEENIRFFASLFNTTLEKGYHLIEEIYSQLEPFSERRAGVLSGGMKQKLALSCALVHQPEVLFLDEPTTGVDPVSRREFWEMLGRLKDLGIAVLVSTSYMDEATRCDRISLIREGGFMVTDTPANIVAGFDRILWSVKGSDMPRLLADLRDNPAVESSFAFGDVHHITVGKGLAKQELEAYLQGKGHTGLEIRDIKPNIEDCYMLLSSK